MRALRYFVGLAVLLTACGGGAAPAGEADGGAALAAAAPAADAPALTGTVIEVKMITDDVGNYFEPATIEARRGDVIRFTLVSGVHNVSFPADQNPAGITLPAPSEYLQLPGQVHDLTVSFPPGEYNFQCDPHALLGMVGKLIVQ